MATTDQATDRFYFRLPQRQKAVIERAAEVSGRSVAEFAREVLTEAARRVVEENERIVLKDDERRRLIAVLSKPPAPNSRLKKAAQDYRRSVRER